MANKTEIGNMELNTTYNEDSLEGLKRLPSGSVDVICTDPPYKYLKNQKLDREFDETVFFDECNRVLKKDGFIILFGRGTSFYRWNTMLAERGFTFKEEIIWDKKYSTSPLMNISRLHETISIHTKGKGTIIKRKVPYLEMREYDLDAVIQDIKRMRAVFKNTKSLDAVIQYLESNQVPTDSDNVLSTSISSIVKTQDRCASVMQGIQEGTNEKTIIRNDRYEADTFTKFGVNADKRKKGDRCVDVINGISQGQTEKTIISKQIEYGDRCDKLGVTVDHKIGNPDRCVAVLNGVVQGLNEKSIIRTDRVKKIHTESGITVSNIKEGDRCVNIMYSVTQGMNEKTIVKLVREHYTAIHPTQKPVRLIERLLNLVCREGAIVVDPFAGSRSTNLACLNTNRFFIAWEIDKEYFDKGAERELKHRESMGLFAEGA